MKGPDAGVQSNPTGNRGAYWQTTGTALQLHFPHSLFLSLFGLSVFSDVILCSVWLNRTLVVWHTWRRRVIKEEEPQVWTINTHRQTHTLMLILAHISFILFRVSGAIMFQQNLPCNYVISLWRSLEPTSYFLHVLQRQYGMDRKPCRACLTWIVWHVSENRRDRCKVKDGLHSPVHIGFCNHLLKMC